MPTENKPAEPSFDLNTSESGRGFIANLFVTVLRRHDFTTYIKERLAVDFACTLSKFIACAQARESELQQRLNAADQRIDELHTMLAESREWLGDGKNADGFARELWTDAYASMIDHIDTTLNTPQ